MDLVQKPLGAEGGFAIKLEGGKVKIEVAHASKGAEVGVHAAVSPEYFVQKLKDAIPGKVDDLIFDALLAMIPR
jgi:hypothetical protein